MGEGAIAPGGPWKRKGGKEGRKGVEVEVLERKGKGPTGPGREDFVVGVGVGMCVWIELIVGRTEQMKYYEYCTCYVSCYGVQLRPELHEYIQYLK